MASWQEAVQAAASHMETTDSTLYFAHLEDVHQATKEYVAAVIQAQEECDAARAQEEEARKEVIKTGNDEDPVFRLLKVTCHVA